jgi:hypothetical protein
MKARYLRRATLEELRDAVPDHIEVYRSGSFPYLDTDFTKFFEVGFDVDEVRIDSFRPCYEALPGLTPYGARDERLWAYLTHTRLLEYARRRWPIPMEDAVGVTHIRQHFFAKDKRAIERDNAASRLWWMAYLCQRIPQLSLPDALRVLLYRSDVRANIIERPTASQSIGVFSAVMKRLHASYIGEKKLFERSVFRPFMIRINSIGGIKLLDCMSETQIAELIDYVVEADLGLASI